MFPALFFCWGEKRMNRQQNGKLTENAQKLRRNMTKEERHLLFSDKKITVKNAALKCPPKVRQILFKPLKGLVVCELQAASPLALL